MYRSTGRRAEVPLKSWVDYERLESADLNAAFAWSQELTLPGAWSSTDGPNTASIASSAYGELKHGAPPAGQDPLAIYRSSDGRLVVPTAGIWLYRATVRADDSTTNDAVQLHLTLDTGRINVGSIQRRAGTSMSQTIVWMAPMAAGQVLMMEARMLSSAGIAGMRAWSLMRMGRGVGAVGAVAGTLLARAGGDEIGAELPEHPEPKRKRSRKP
jgi:hypothetical protein